MAWIESHDELPTHPKTLKAARKLKTNVPTVIGHLHVLWYWCLTHRPDGRLTEMDADDVADAAGWADDGDMFVGALVAAGWLDDDAGTLAVHDWWEGAGKTIKRRKYATARQRKARDTDNVTPDPDPGHGEHEDTSHDSHGDVTRDTRVSHGADSDSDKDQTHDDAAAPSPIDLGFSDFWDSYPRHAVNGKPGGGGSRKKAEQRWRRMSKPQREQSLAAVDNYREWVESPEGEFPAHATTWLNEARWEQWQDPADTLPPQDADTLLGDRGYA